jgi:hypothetical protein
MGIDSILGERILRHSQIALTDSQITLRLTHMLALSTYMGHARLESTYWYLESTPQLMADIGTPERLFLV